jgi:hypothetical protein
VATEIMALSPSIAHILLTRSPWHAWQHHRLGGGMKSKPTDATRRGNLFETLLLGEDSDVVVVLADDWRTKAAQEKRSEAESAGKTAVLAKDYKTANDQAAACAAMMSTAVLRVAREAEKQKTLEWVSNGVACKGRLDIYHPESRSIIDLKVTEDASPRAVMASVAKYGTDVQAAAYVEGAGLSGTTGPWTFSLLHVEPEYGVACHRMLSESCLRVGQMKWERAKRIWKKCFVTGVWTAYDESPIEAPAWAVSEQEQLERGETF